MAIYDIKPETSPKIPPRLKEFISYLTTVKGKSVNTVQAYTYDLSIFFRFVLIYKGIVPSDSEFEEIDLTLVNDSLLAAIDLSTLYAFLAFLENQRENSSYARARKVAALKTFFKFLYSKIHMIKEDPTADLESPRIRKRNPVYLSLDESVSLLQSMDKTHRDYHRDYCMLTLFLNCGMRISELVSIQRKMIREDTLRIIGKGNKERTVYLNRACLEAIESHLAHLSLDGVKEEHRDYLFLSSHKMPISKRTVERLVKKHIANAGISGGKYTPHKLRHTAATLMYKHGNVDIRALQTILGHENLTATQIYTHVDNEQLRESIASNPLNDIDEWEDLSKDSVK